MIESLKHAPADLPERYVKLAEKAAGPTSRGALRASIKLFCIQCMGWDYPEARDCEARVCPLWVQSRACFSKTAAPRGPQPANFKRSKDGEPLTEGQP